MGIFDGAVGGLLGGLGQLGSSFIQAESARDANTVNYDINKKQLEFNKEQAQWNRDFQERMSSTAWQRGIADMKAAGINPMFSFSSGGSSTPTGSSASSGSLNAMQPIPSVLGGVVSTALETARAISEIQKNDATIKKTDAEKLNIHADTLNKQTDNPNIAKKQDLILAQIKSEIATAFAQRHLGKLNQAATPGKKAESDILESQALPYRGMPRTTGIIDYLLNSVLKASQSFKNFNPVTIYK